MVLGIILPEPLLEISFSKASTKIVVVFETASAVSLLLVPVSVVVVVVVVVVDSRCRWEAFRSRPPPLLAVAVEAVVGVGEVSLWEDEVAFRRVDSRRLLPPMTDRLDLLLRFVVVRGSSPLVVLVVDAEDV